MNTERPARFYHIVFRKAKSSLSFDMERDFEKWTETLESLSKREGMAVHCFCMMPDHYQLLLEIDGNNLSGVLRKLRSSRNGNRNGQEKGTANVKRGRHKVFPVFGLLHLIEISRQIHLSPVREELTCEPARYPWSSYSAFLEGEGKWNWLRRNTILDQFSSDEIKARERYRNFTWQQVRKFYLATGEEKISFLAIPGERGRG